MQRTRIWISGRSLAAVLGGLTLLLAPASGQALASEFEYRSLNGHGNNVAHPTWGEAGTQFPRVVPAHYPDGSGAAMASEETERPNPRYLSNRIFNAGERDVRSPHNQSQWVWVWGQFVDHTLDLKESEEEEANIPFNSSDPLEAFKDTLGYIPFKRVRPVPGTGTSASNPRQFNNTVPSFIDDQDLYGHEQSRLEWMRTGPDNGNPAEAGAELMLPGGYLPRATARGDAAAAPAMATEGRLEEEPQDRVVTGDVRGNENSELTATTTLFAREHNRIVSLLPKTLSEEERFQIGKLVVGAEMQYITYTEWLPELGITLPAYPGYNPSVNPSVALEFAGMGFRMHSIVNGEEEMEVSTSHYTAAQLEALEQLGVGVQPIETFEGNKPGYLLVIPQSAAFFDPDAVEDLGLGVELKGLATGKDPEGYRNDEQITNELRSVLFQIPKPGGSTTEFECFNEPELPECFTGVSDLGAIDVQRGYDFGLPTYAELRAAYGLAPKSTFDGVTGDSSEELPAGDTINTPAISEFTALENYWHEPIPINSPENATYDTKRSTLAARLKAIYGSVSKLDAFAGMLAEPTTPGTEMGELQRAILTKQFEALRVGDRFFYLNDLPALETIEKKYGVTYKHSLSELLSIDAGIPQSQLQADVFGAPPPPHHMYKAEEKNWALSGSLTDKKQNEAIKLPSGSTFNGSGEVNHETGAGSVSGNVSIPKFTRTFNVSGISITVGFKLTEAGAFAGSLTGSNGLEALSIPAKLNVAITEVKLKGSTIAIQCTTAEPPSLNLADTLDLEEFLSKGWQFAGTFTLPKFTCEGGSVGKAIGAVLTASLSGPENSYTIAITAP